jgi:signal transduction histidine kinase
MPSLNFTVDSALLRELGERLVGKPHIALAELVKNSYDADATKVTIRLLPDRIEILDNGHGMAKPEFRNFWMRIGTTHKIAERVSRNFKRPLTGSKGVGRLAVQFLASELEIRTVSENNPDTEFLGNVDWEKASRAGELTKAKADYTEGPPTEPFPDGSKNGTAVILKRLHQEWDAESIKNLAREIRWLKPPFRPNPRLKTDRQMAFDVTFEALDADLLKTFSEQMDAILHLWNAKLVGKLEDASRAESKGAATRNVVLSLEFADGAREDLTYPVENCILHYCEFEILIYKLKGRQALGVKKTEAHEYLQEFGGVHIYDAGFHLPYYGLGIDWLGIEMDHSHRKTVSELLPKELQIHRGLNFLPTQSRILGVAHVDTSSERHFAETKRKSSDDDYLKVQITRDRLVDNKAFNNLATIVRTSIDFYAMKEAARAFAEAEANKDTEPVRDKVERVEQVIEDFKGEMPAEVYLRLKSGVRETISAADSEAEAAIKQFSLLGPLATAGISALAYNHEINKQIYLLESIATEITTLASRPHEAKRKLLEISTRLRRWIAHTRSTRQLFLPLAEPENREIRERLKVLQTLTTIKAQTTVLTRGAEIDLVGIDPKMRFPKGSFAEWSAIFQNVFINATNAMLDSAKRRISVSSREQGRKTSILVQDTGSGVDLKAADDLFEPFVRKLEISQGRRALGFGGMGLGLTIVRMMANNLGCHVSFVDPDEGFGTAFQLTWKEAQ